MTIEQLMDKALSVYKTIAPKKTGWLASQLQGELTSDGFIIYVDLSQVPYFRYTTDKWDRGGLVNPNQDWDHQATDLIVLIMQQLLQANKISDNDIDRGEI